MRILNIGCGAMRPSEPFINLDNLYALLKDGTPERTALNNEPNYINCDLLLGNMPFGPDSMDGVALYHCLEHFMPSDGVKLLKDCRRILKPGASLVISVPDASYFRKVDAEDRNENWQRLFGEGSPTNPIPTFREAALFFNEHLAILTEDSVWCYVRQAGFVAESIQRIDTTLLPKIAPGTSDLSALDLMLSISNRHKFSLIMAVQKSTNSLAPVSLNERTQTY